MQNAGFPNKRIGEFLTSRDGGQFTVENTGEGEQIVALVLQRDAHRANPPCILSLALRQFRNDEIEQYLPGRQVRTRQRQHVVAQPLREHSHVADEPAGLNLGLPRQFQLDDKLIVRARLAGAVDRDLYLLAPRCRTLGDM
jgi:hypothetical protein